MWLPVLMLCRECDMSIACDLDVAAGAMHAIVTSTLIKAAASCGECKSVACACAGVGHTVLVCGVGGHVRPAQRPGCHQVLC